MKHIPAMLQESLEIFQGQHLFSFFDATLGAGGFAKALLTSHPEIKTYYGCDQDSNALQLAKQTLQPFEGKVEFIHSNFSFVKKLLEERKVSQVDGFFLI